MGRETVARHYSSILRTYDNGSLSTMNYLIQLMMLVRHIQNQIADSLPNIQDQIDGGDCSAADRE